MANLAQETEKLKNAIVGAVNDSPLPITVKKYIVADIYRELEIVYSQELYVKESEPTDEQSV